MFRKARTRIAGAGALVTLALLALFAAMARVAIERIMTADLDDELETLSIAIASDLETRGSAEPTHESLRTGVEANILAFRLEHHAAVLFDRSRVLAATGDLARRARPQNLVVFAGRNEMPFTGPEPFTGHGRICRFRVIRLHGNAEGETLVVLRSMEGLLKTLDTVDGALTLLVLFGAGASALVVALATSRALVPVEKLTLFAQRITAHDLSERVHVDAAGEEFDRLAAVINSLLERLHRAFDAQRRLVSDAAHELKTPAAVLAAEAQELARGTLPESEAREALQTILRTASGLAHEVDDLLELARGDAAAPQQHEVFDVEDAVETAFALAAPLARERGIALVRPERASVELRGDRAAIVRATGNLLTNAFRYAPRGSEVRLSVRASDTGCEIEVADRGPGVPADDRRRIFERFVRLAPARRSHPEGAGLGLAIADQAVRAHGGSIEVEDHEGGGALFRMRIPRAAPPSPAA